MNEQHDLLPYLSEVFGDALEGVADTQGFEDVECGTGEISFIDDEGRRILVTITITDISQGEDQ